jgi:uncharacterized protein (TIGR02266 family)
MADYANIPLDSRRVPLATKVQFKFDRFSGFISEYSANISPTGMYIVSEKPEPVGRILDLEFRLGDGFEIITGQGEVVWSRSVPEGPSRPPGMGIRFMELSPGSKDLIRRIVDQYVAQGGIPFDLTGMYAAPPLPPEPALPPLAQEPDPFDLPEPVRDSAGSALPWFSAQASAQKESASMPSGKALPPLEPLDEEIFKLEEPALSPAPGPVAAQPLAQSVLPFPFAAAPAMSPASELDETAAMTPPPSSPSIEMNPSIEMKMEEDPFPPFVDPLELTQAGPTVGFDEPLPEPFQESLSASAAPSLSPVETGPVSSFDSSGALGSLGSSGSPGSPLGSMASVGSPGPADTAPLAPPSLGPESDPFAAFLPKPAAPAEQPPVRPLSTLAGGASVHQPRRTAPWMILVLLLVGIGLAAFLLRNQIMGWMGLGGDGEDVVAETEAPPLRQPEPAPATPPTLQEELSLTSDAQGSTLEPSPPGAAIPPGAPAPAPPIDEPDPAQPLPEVVQRKPAATYPAAAPAAAMAGPAAGPSVTAIDRITFESAPNGTVVVLWGNGAIRPESYKRVSLTDPAREVIQVRGMTRPFSPVRIQAGTGELRQIRVGYHQKGGGNELHIVLDLEGPRVKVVRIEPDGQRLRIHLQGG